MKSQNKINSALAEDAGTEMGINESPPFAIETWWYGCGNKSSDGSPFCLLNVVQSKKITICDSLVIRSGVIKLWVISFFRP